MASSWSSCQSSGEKLRMMSLSVSNEIIVWASLSKCRAAFHSRRLAAYPKSTVTTIWFHV